MIEKFRLSTLNKIDDGRIREAYEQALKACEADCKDRPNLKDARSVTLHAVLVPVSGDSGEMESCDVQFQIFSRVPKRKSKVYNMISKGGNLLFNELSPEDVRQGTLDDAPSMKAVGHAR